VLVIADAERIGQVVTNYLASALKYSKEDKPIEVRLQVEQDVMGTLVRMSVRDEGPGLSRSDQEHLFELFPQIEETAVQSGSGVSLGLGLYLCKAISEAHGGLVGAESESEVGYCSSFYFPSLRPAPTPTLSPAQTDEFVTGQTALRATHDATHCREQPISQSESRAW
jgi:signal transduction histidine kinase